MSISSEITRISNAKTAIAESIANKGVTVPSGTKIDGMATLIDSIQTGGAAVQPSKALTVTSNGTTTITPDAPYDAIKQVDLTVNVASGGGGGETAENVVITSSLPSNLNEYIQICGIDKDGNKILLNGYTTPVSVKKNTPLMIRIAEYLYARISGQYTIIGIYSPTQNRIVDGTRIVISGDNRASLIVPTGDLNIYDID